MFAQKFVLRKKISPKVGFFLITLALLIVVGSFQFFRWLEHQRTISTIENYIKKDILVLAQHVIDEYLKENSGSEEIYRLKLEVLQKKRKSNEDSFDLHRQILQTIIFAYNKGMIDYTTYHRFSADAYFSFGHSYYPRVIYHISKLNLKQVDKEERLRLLRMKIISSEALGDFETSVDSLEQLATSVKDDVQVIIRLARGYVLDGRFTLAHKILEESFSFLIAKDVKDLAVKRDLSILSYCLVDLLDRMGLKDQRDYYEQMLLSFDVDKKDIKKLQKYLTDRSDDDDLYVFDVGYVKPLTATILL